MSKTISIPMGSQHVALLEPLHFRFQTENEKVVHVDADVGYVHRGIEQACCSKFKYRQVAYVVGRVCGLCAISHSTCYSQAVEQILGLEVPKRAKQLRILVSELDRIHSHLLCLAHTAENTGFEALFMNIMRDREAIMELLELVTGNRVQFDFASVGKVNRDVSPATAAEIKRRLKEFRPKLDELDELFRSNWTLSLRFKGVGVLDKATAMRLNAVGPLARAAGLAIDVRNETEHLLPWKEMGWKMITDTAGDVHARSTVRLREMYVCLDVINNVLDGLAEGPLEIDTKALPNGEAGIRLEAPRGEVFYYVRAAKNQVLDRLKIKTPTFSNIAAMKQLFLGADYASIPAILASLDPCLSCTAR